MHFTFFDLSFQVRLSFETFASDAARALARLEELQDTLSQRDLPRDLEGARRLMEEHAALKKRATKASVEELDAQGRRLLQKLQSQTAGGGGSSESGYGNRSGGASGDSNDHHHGFHVHADAHNLVAKVTGLLDKLHGTRQNLQQLWHMRKLKLDQCFQLRLFEQDAEKVRVQIHSCLCGNMCQYAVYFLMYMGCTEANLMHDLEYMPVFIKFSETLH